MRLAVFTTRFPSKVCTFFARDMRALLEAGIEIDVFPIRPETRAFWHYVPDILNQRVLPKDRVHHIGWHSILGSLGQVRRPSVLSRCLHDGATLAGASLAAGVAPLAKTLYVLPIAWAWAQRFGKDYDHILAYWAHYAGTCAYMAHRLAQRPIPFTLYVHAGADLYRNQVFLRQKLLYADTIVTECEYNRHYMRERFGDVYERIADKIHVNHMGLDFDEFPYEPDHRAASRVLGVGRFVKTKGYDFLLRAVAELCRRGTKVELELVGDGEERRSLETLAAELQIADRVKFRGWLRFDEVREAMQRASVFVHPSSGVGDAKPNVIEEAIALGTPVVASRVAGIPELLDYGNCGILVPARDVRALADGIETLLRDAELRRSYSERARRHAEQILDLWRNGARLAERLRATQR